MLEVGDAGPAPMDVISDLTGVGCPVLQHNAGVVAREVCAQLREGKSAFEFECDVDGGEAGAAGVDGDVDASGDVGGTQLGSVATGQVVCVLGDGCVEIGIVVSRDMMISSGDGNGVPVRWYGQSAREFSRNGK